MNVLSIQSHVVYGRVGNRAAVFPLERLGIDVWPLCTVQFSNHKGYGTYRGTEFSAGHIASLWRGLADLGLASSCDGILSGYLGRVETGEAVLDIVGEAKRANPRTLYFCDPVMGDSERGLYVVPGLVDFYRSRALPAATCIKPNQFEAEILSGIDFGEKDGLRRACDALHLIGPRVVIVTSAPLGDREPGAIRTLLSLGDEAWALDTPRIEFDIPPHGAGDLVSALFLGNYLMSRDPLASLERCMNAVYAVFEETRRAGTRELALLAAQEKFVDPGSLFRAERAW